MIQPNILLLVFLVIFLTSTVCRWSLARLNRGHIRTHGHCIPEGFENLIDAKGLSQIASYTVDTSRFGSLASLFNDAVLLAILLSGVLPWFADHVASLHLPFVLSALLFLAGPAALGFILDIPFDLYRIFTIERQYGFSTINWKLWVSDTLKETAISLILAGIILGSFFALILYTPHTWWFWSWMLFGLFQILLLWLYPVIIAPLFNTYEPIRDDELRGKIVAMVERAGFRTRGIFQVDAGKRSRHTNAYFTGLGKSKRIVLFDTLLGSHSHDELLAVLAHEIGHWKKRHLLKQLLVVEMISFAVFYGIYRLLGWNMLYHTFGFDQAIPYIGIFLLSALSGPVVFFLKPAGSIISRKHEREADDYSIELMGTAQPLMEALKRLAKDNLSNLHPHPVYAWFYYSHPSLPARIRRLQSLSGK